jgi:hypothetical protein
VPLASGGHFTVVDDYGHHRRRWPRRSPPRAGVPGRRLLLAFQPHRFTRTRDLFEDFVRVLSTVDELVLADVYPAGEAPIVAADGRSLARAVRVAGKVEPLFVEKTAEMREAVLSRVRDGDVVLTMGAGSIGAPGARARRFPGHEAMDMSEAANVTPTCAAAARDEPMARHVSWRAGGARARSTSPRACRPVRVPAHAAAGEPILFVGSAATCWCATAASTGRGLHAPRAHGHRGRASAADFRRARACPRRTSRASSRSTAARARNGWRACRARSAARSR